MLARRLVPHRGNGRRFLTLIVLQLALCGALAHAMELPADLMLESVNLLKSVEYAQQQEQQQHHAHERRQFPLVATAIEGDVTAELPPILVSAVDGSAELGAEELANAAEAREQAENRASDGGNGMDVLVPATDYTNMAAKLQQQQQRQPPLWLQMHGVESAPLSHQRERQQPDYEHHHHHYNNNNNNNKGTFVKLPQQQHKHIAHQPVSTTPAATLPPPPPPPPQRRCAIEITTKLSGVCQSMAPIGSACIAGDYMDVYNLDCM